MLEDFIYRSVVTGIEVGKKLTTLFYDEGYSTSYYLGCSTGGRQGFKLAQDFPDELDGIVAGAPAINFIGLLSWSAHFYGITGPTGSDTWLPQDKWSLVHDEILRQCDKLDGAKDGILEDPSLCRPNMTSIQCSAGSSSSNCITAAQVNTVHQVFEPLRSTNGSVLYPRMQPGSEIAAAEGVYNGQPFPFSRDWWKYVVYNPSWNATTWTVKDADVAFRQNPYNAQTWKSDLSPLRDSGTKLLHYHGLMDSLVSSADSKWYYHRVMQEMGLRPEQVDEFYRFFTISGMAHCHGGDGAHAIGNVASALAGTDPEENVLMAMVQWVEEGIPPETVRGTRPADESETSVEWHHKHCRYPRRNVYKGPGGPHDEDAWECVMP